MSAVPQKYTGARTVTAFVRDEGIAIAMGVALAAAEIIRYVGQHVAMLASRMLG